MWGLFFAAVLAGVVFLYLPGMLALLGFRVRPSFAFALAPLLGVPATVALTIGYSMVGVESNWVSVFLPQIILGLSLLLVGRTFGFSFDGCSSEIARSDLKNLLLYLILGVALSSIMFVTFLQDPTHYSQGYDNVTHLGSIRSYVDSGNWSPFGISLYVGADGAIAPLSGSGFYPSVWYDVAAFMVSLLGVPVSLSENAANLVFIGVVYPSCMFAFIRVVFRDSPEVVPWGAVCTLAFSAFPWQILAWGPLYPNTAAFCFLPLVSAMFIGLLSDASSVKRSVSLLLLFLLGAVTLALSQPNAVFSLGVWLAPFLVYRVGVAAGSLRFRGEAGWGFRILASIATVFAICLIWVVMYRLPFLQAVVQYSWIAVLSKPEAFLSALTLGFMTSGTQLILMVLVVVGGLWTLRNRQWLWLSFSFAFACGLFVVDASSDGPLQHLLTGFWYTDYYRVAAMAAMFAVPLASMGASYFVNVISGVLRGLCGSKSNFHPRLGAIAAILALLFVGTVFPASGSDDDDSGIASKMKGNSFYSVWGQLSWGNNVDFVYTTEEKEFVKKAKGVLPEETLVINNPNDGSCFCFVADDLRTYYRYLNTYGAAGESSDSELIRGRLDAVAYDDEVKSAVRNVGAEYVLLLDQGREHDPEDPDSYFFLGNERTELWNGINSIRDDTPGFEVVLAQKDMRLYRIVETEDLSSLQ